MALEDILRKIQQDAEAEAAAVLAEARVQSEAVLAQGRARAQAAAERIHSAGATAAEEARRRELATASVEIRQLVLSAKQQVLEQVFAGALDRLAGLDDAQYRGLLADLAVRAAVRGDEQVVVSPRDRSRLDDQWLAAVNARISTNGLPGKLTFAARTREMRGGLILQAGDIEVNCSFERTLALLQDALEPEIATLLFDTEAAGASVA